MELKKIKSTHHRDQMVEISTVLSDLASQEGCDGEPYDEMMEAAEYITELEEKISIMEKALKNIANPLDCLLKIAKKSRTDIDDKTACDLSNSAALLKGWAYECLNEIKE